MLQYPITSSNVLWVNFLNTSIVNIWLENIINLLNDKDFLKSKKNIDIERSLYVLPMWYFLVEYDSKDIKNSDIKIFENEKNKHISKPRFCWEFEYKLKYYNIFSIDDNNTLINQEDLFKSIISNISEFNGSEKYKSLSDRISLLLLELLK